MSNATLVGGQIVYGVHDESMCRGKYCTIHRPSDHHMNDWPQLWSWGWMYRVCEHDISHRDPDDDGYEMCSTLCDGCCQPPTLEQITKFAAGILEELS